MKEKDILEVIGGIDEEMILDAAPNKGRKKQLPWGRIGAAAACATLVLAGALVAAPYLSDVNPTQTTTEATYSETTTAIASRYAYGSNYGIFFSMNEIGMSEAMFVSESHQRKIMDERYDAYQSARVIDPVYVGEKIEDVKVYAYWYHNGSGTKTEEEYLSAEVYRIKGVDPSVAVCVKYLEPSDSLSVTHYYTFINEEIRFESLGEFFDLYDAEEYFSIKENVVMDHLIGEDLSYTVYSLNGNVATALGDILLSVDAEKNELTEDSYVKIVSESQKQARLRFDLNSFGVANYMFFVTDGGYLLMTLCGEDIYFDIGKDKALAIVSLIENNGMAHVYDDESIVTETTKR